MTNLRIYIVLICWLFGGYGSCSGLVVEGKNSTAKRGTKTHDVTSNSLCNKEKLKKLRELKIMNVAWNVFEIFMCIRNAQICARRASARQRARCEKIRRAITSLVISESQTDMFGGPPPIY